MARCQLAFAEQQLHALRQRQQAQGVGDVAAALPERAREIFLGVLEVVDQAAVALRFFKRGQVLSLNVLDDRQLERLGVAEVADDDRHLMQLGALGRPPAPLTGDNLELVRPVRVARSEEHTSELQSLMRISYAVFCLKKK